MNHSARDVGPDHYKAPTGADIQAWDIIDAFQLDFYRGNVVKYLCRAGRKDDELADLRKAAHYLQRSIEMAEGVEEESRKRDGAEECQTCGLHINLCDGHTEPEPNDCPCGLACHDCDDSPCDDCSEYRCSENAGGGTDWTQRCACGLHIVGPPGTTAGVTRAGGGTHTPIRCLNIDPLNRSSA